MADAAVVLNVARHAKKIYTSVNTYSIGGEGIAYE